MAKGGLGKWFQEEWVDISRKDKSGKDAPCGRDKADTASAGYPKCRPKAEAQQMSAEARKLAVRRKRSKPQGVGGKPTIVT
jgi:hypothetical protein